MNLPGAQHSPTTARVFASPFARRMAREAGISVANLRGSGPSRRVLARDVRAFLAAAPEHAVVRDISPHAYIRRTIAVDALLDLCGRLIEPRRSLISADDLLVKAAAHAHIALSESLPQHGDGTQSVDIAVAVVTENGIRMAVLRDVDTRSVSSVSTGLADLRDRVTQEETATDDAVAVSIANLGRYGVEEFAICQLPTHCPTLTLGAARREPVVVDGAVIAATVIHATLSFDTRFLGVEIGAQWLDAFATTVENPLWILS